MAFPQDPLLRATLLALLAGATIPVGGLLARVERIQPRWLERELRHTVIAFGGGALLAAVSLVLVPDGLEALAPAPACAAFLAGGALVMALDRWIATRRGQAGQFLAMLLDFLPESAALGASISLAGGSGPLLAFLIALQNLPEAFNAYREMTQGRPGRRRRTLWLFAALPLAGPASALLGASVLAGSPGGLGTLMLACAGGLLYLTFQDVAPKAYLARHWAPPLGAVGGFALGLVGFALTR
jgi:ZIP family zinc transporter